MIDTKKAVKPWMTVLNLCAFAFQGSDCKKSSQHLFICLPTGEYYSNNAVLTALCKFLYFRQNTSHILRYAFQYSLILFWPFTTLENKSKGSLNLI